jgi:hypothetical protein
MPALKFAWLATCLVIGLYCLWIVWEALSADNYAKACFYLICASQWLKVEKES